MWTHRVSVIAALVCVACGSAQAIPAPWSIEEWKGKADLIVIARTTTAAPANAVRGANRCIGIEPVEVLKGKLPKPQGKAGKEDGSRLQVLFFQPPPPVPGPIQRRAVGGPGHPDPKEREFALIFLKKGPRPRQFAVTMGSFGYVGLRTGTRQQTQALAKRLRMYRKWCERIGKKEIRAAMDGYYAKTLALVGRIATLHGTVIRKPWTKTLESWHAGGGEYYVLDVGRAALPAGRRSAKEGVILRPSQAVPADALEKHKARRVVVEGLFVEPRPYTPPPDSAEQRPAGKEPILRGGGFQAYAIRPADRKPA